MPSLYPLFLRRAPSPSFPHRLPLRRRTTSVTMSTSLSSPSSLIDHVVLFKVKPTADPTAVTAMINNLNSLKTLPLVLHLSAGPIHRFLHSPSPHLHFTHLLHSRYRSVSDLNSYSDHPDHLSVVRSSVLPVIDDIMSLDWVNQGIDTIDGSDSVSVSPGVAMRVQFVKLKEGTGERETEEVLEVIGGVKGKVKEVEGVSYGVNFSPGRAKGFLIGSIGVFRGIKELEAAVGRKEVEEEKKRVREYIDGVVVADYVVSGAGSGSASL